MTNNENLTLSSVEDVLYLAPYLLGYQPDESVVLIWLSGGALTLTTRMDLDDVPRWKSEEATDWMNMVQERSQADSIVVAVFSEDDEAAEMAALTVEALSPVPVLESVRTNGETWQAREATGVYDPKSSAVAAAMVFRGVAPVATREDVAGQIEPVQESEALTSAEDRAEVRVAQMTAAEQVRAAQRLMEKNAGQGWSLEDAQEMGHLLDTGEVRDSFYLTMNRDNAAEQVEKWSDVVRSTGAKFSGGPLSLLAIAAWLSGKGVLMTLCCDRIDALDVTPGAASLLHMIQDNAVPPTAWDMLLGGM